MSRHFLAFFLLLSSTLSAEAMARKLVYSSAPPNIGGPYSLQLAAPMPAEQNTAKGVCYLDDEHLVVYRTDFGGGGVAVGLLFGPLGVAANAAAIKKANENESAQLHNKIPASPRALLQRALDTRPAVVESTSEAQLSPSMFVTRDKAGKLYVWTVVDVTVGEWKGRYSSLSSARPTVATLAQGMAAAERDQFEAELVASYARALETLAADADGSLSAFAPRKVQIEALSPRFSSKVKYEHVLERDGNIVVRALDPKANQLVGGFGFTGVLVVQSSMVQL